MNSGPWLAAYLCSLYFSSLKKIYEPIFTFSFFWEVFNNRKLWVVLIFVKLPFFFLWFPVFGKSNDSWPEGCRFQWVETAWIQTCLTTWRHLLIKPEEYLRRKGINRQLRNGASVPDVLLLPHIPDINKVKLLFSPEPFYKTYRSSTNLQHSSWTPKNSSRPLQTCTRFLPNQ